MTFEELKAMFRGLGGYGSDDDSVHDLFINEAYRRICRRRAWSWLRSTATATMTPGVIEYTWANFGIAADPPRRLHGARLVDSTVSPPEILPLTWMEPEQFRDARGDTTTTWPPSDREEPVWWTRIAGTGVAVWWPPDLAYKLVLSYTAPAETLSAGVTPRMPRDYHDAIPYEAAYQMAARQRDQIALTEFRAERDAILAQLEAEDSVGQTQSYEQIGGKEIWQSLERRY